MFGKDMDKNIMPLVTGNIGLFCPFYALRHMSVI